jgi:hypothetical protein
MTRFIPISGPTGATWLVHERRASVLIVGRHGLGDIVFFSPCFKMLAECCDQLYYASSVSAYATLWAESPYVKILRLGGTNNSNLGLMEAEHFCAQAARMGVELGKETFVYHFGLHEPIVYWRGHWGDCPTTHPAGYSKGRRNVLEFGWPGVPAEEPFLYHVAPDRLPAAYVHEALGRWLAGRELIVIARYGHTDAAKNLYHRAEDGRALCESIEARYPGRFGFLSLDAIPHEEALEGHFADCRSWYGFLTNDSATLWHVLSRAALLITCNTGPMVVGASIPSLKMLTVWRVYPPYQFLDPHPERPVTAISDRPELLSTHFTTDWTEAQRAALLAHWRTVHCELSPASMGAEAVKVLEEP